nr:hypothetical protein [Rodentibacter genomosp. 2]
MSFLKKLLYGQSQAVRLPVDFEFNAKQIYIRKEANGDIVLSMHSQQQSSWDKMWVALDKLDGCDFLTPEERYYDI